MKKSVKKETKVIPIDGTDRSERWIPVPNPGAGTLRLKGMYRKRGNCYFATGVPRELMPFIYRAAIRLKIRETALIFSRGAVRKRGRSVKDLVSVTELDWAVGISVIIPKSLKKNETVTVEVEGKSYQRSLMELVVLAGLFRLNRPKRRPAWHNAMAVAVLCRGWKEMDREDPPPYSIIQPHR